MNFLQPLSQTSVIPYLQHLVPLVRVHWAVCVGIFEVNAFYTLLPFRGVECLRTLMAWVGDLSLELAGQEPTLPWIAKMSYPHPVSGVLGRDKGHSANACATSELNAWTEPRFPGSRRHLQAWE